MSVENNKAVRTEGPERMGGSIAPEHIRFEGSRIRNFERSNYNWHNYVSKYFVGWLKISLRKLPVE